MSQINGNFFYNKQLVEDNIFYYKTIVNIGDFLLEKFNERPLIGIICGSGLGSIADIIDNSKCINYTDIPNFPNSTVIGHQGKLIFGLISNIPIICMQGRLHYYEGYPLKICTMPIRVMKQMGIQSVIISNAAGGINATYKIGDLMLIKDHINFLGLFSDANPIIGPNDDNLGPRFLAMNNAYDKDILQYAKKVALEKFHMKDYLHEGIYGCVSGPTYETVAEVKMLNILGVDSVGMSTAYEVVVAKHCGLRVFAFSLITNKAISDYESDQIPNHAEVLQVAHNRMIIVKDFIKDIVKYLKP